MKVVCIYRKNHPNSKYAIEIFRKKLFIEIIKVKESRNHDAIINARSLAGRILTSNDLNRSPRSIALCGKFYRFFVFLLVFLFQRPVYWKRILSIIFKINSTMVGIHFKKKSDFFKAVTKGSKARR